MIEFDAVLTVASIGIALCFAVWATLRFVKRLRRNGEPLPRKIGRYIKELLDALWGAG